MKASSTIASLLLVFTLGCSANDSDRRGMMERPIASSTVGDQGEAQRVVETLINEQCANGESCRFATQNFGKPLKFKRLLDSPKTLSYDRVFRTAANSESEQMVRGETPAWIFTGLFLDGSEEVTVDFTVRRDVHGMTVDEIALGK